MLQISYSLIQNSRVNESTRCLDALLPVWRLYSWTSLMKSHLHHSVLQKMCYGDIAFIQMHLVNPQVTKLKRQLRLFEMGFLFH